jgi:hypothetical protein
MEIYIIYSFGQVIFIMAKKSIPAKNCLIFLQIVPLSKKVINEAFFW